ncbi:MAG: cytochrome c oxidase subunit II [Acidimicrobiia bacterium]
MDHQNRKSAVVATRPGRRLLGLVASLGLLLAACSGSGPQTALNPAGPVARTIDNLWEMVFVLAVIVFVLVEGALLFTIYRWRARKDDDTEPVQVHGNTRLEIVWTIIPVVVLAFVAVPMVKGVFDVRAVAQGSDVLQVQVTGHQWWWEFEYVDLADASGRTIDTANELVIPEDTKVNLTMTSADVIHSFWVPTLNGKRDVVPNRITNLTLIADDPTPPDQPHPGQCAEFCGLAHADMRFKVHVRTKADFDAWVQEQLQPAQTPTDGAAAAGLTAFSSTCVACHDATVAGDSGIQDIGPVRTIEVDGVTFRSSLAPNLTHFASRATFAGSVFENTTDHLAQWLANPSALKPMRPDLNDVPNGRILGMPNYNLSSDDISNLIALLEGWK